MARILFCEDEPAIRKLILAALRSSGHEVKVVGDGAEGLASINLEPPDVIFTDISMPVMDGYQLWTEIQSRPELQRIPVVVLTASVQPNELTDLRDRGLVHYIAKPFKVAELRAMVNRMLER